jgi:catechol 2,3-dioxygenase-like lactoylglutathione lyase family enzyme
MKRKAIVILSILFVIGAMMVSSAFAQKEYKPQYLGIFHTGITVNNLDVTIPFYKDVLGLKLVLGPTAFFVNDQLCYGLGTDCPASLRLAIFEVPGGGKETLEILEYTGPTKDITNGPIPANTWGAHHVAFRVKDIEAMIARLEAHGVTFFAGPNDNPSGDLAGWRWIYFQDPTNCNPTTGRCIIMEFIEIDPRIIEH